MKVYKWFKRGELYALTNDKGFYKVFSKTRNPKVFDFIEDEVNDINEYIEIANYSRGCVLTAYELTTSDNEARTKKKKVRYVLTENEITQLTERLGIIEVLGSFDDEFHDLYHAYYCFKDKLIKALNKLEFKDVYILMDRDEYYTTNSFEWDTVELFISLFGNTLK